MRATHSGASHCRQTGKAEQNPGLVDTTALAHLPRLPGRRRGPTLVTRTIVKVRCGLAWILPLFSLCSPCQAGDLDALAGSWRITHGTVAPGAAGVIPDARRLLQQAVEFSASGVRADSVLGCGNVRYERHRAPLEGLFQGTLPAPQAQHAHALGILQWPVDTVQVTCDTGVFDYHLARPSTALVALDNVIWTLQFQAGKPRDAVRGFLRTHFAGDMGFRPDSVQSKARWLSDGLWTAVEGYLALPQAPDQVPLIAGDPFTNSQEYPSGFTVGKLQISGNSALVRVSYAHGGAKRRLHFRLERGAEGWRIDDILYSDGSTLRKLLADSH